MRAELPLPPLLRNAEKGTHAEQRFAVHFPHWKRALDLTLVTITAPIWFGLMVALTVWIKLVSRGPVFYRQDRVGLGGRRFLIYKFRSMKVNVETHSHETYAQWLIKGDRPMVKLDGSDARLIRGARWLRASGLDELAQILNVLKGEMSLVGPRPSTVYEAAVFKGGDRDRFNAPPGLTGLWQVSGKNQTTFSEMIALDIAYTRRMSVWLDLEIVAKTPGVLVGQLVDCRKNTRRPSTNIIPLGPTTIEGTSTETTG
jgi:lipopolysaccharide/colanic/teichoic acid biosynthesis glycosyltransferase